MYRDVNITPNLVYQKEKEINNEWEITSLTRVKEKDTERQRQREGELQAIREEHTKVTVQFQMASLENTHISNNMLSRLYLSKYVYTHICRQQELIFVFKKGQESQKQQEGIEECWEEKKGDRRDLTI